MLNYLSAEFYKLRFHKGLYIGTGLLILLESQVFLPGVMVWEQDYIGRDILLAFLVVAMTVGIIIAPIFATMTFDDQNGNGTLKNEIVYGIPRHRAYIGKMLAGAIAGTVISLLAMGWFLLLTFLVGGSSGGTDQDFLGILIWATWIQWLVWMSVYAFFFFLLVLIRSAAAALSLGYVVTVLGTPVALTIASGTDGSFFWQLVSDLFFTSPLRFIVGLDPSDRGLLVSFLGDNPLLYALVICIFWWAVSILLGLIVLRRREIK